jgi:hypothetical protein
LIRRPWSFTREIQPRVDALERRKSAASQSLSSLALSSPSHRRPKPEVPHVVAAKPDRRGCQHHRCRGRSRRTRILPRLSRPPRAQSLMRCRGHLELEHRRI